MQNAPDVYTPYAAQLALSFGNRVNVTTRFGTTFRVVDIRACYSPGTYDVQYMLLDNRCDNIIGHASNFTFTKG